jgi:hypothetical protein
MTTGVNIDVILNCFFTCKDRASERDRPYQRKKKIGTEIDMIFGDRVGAAFVGTPANSV